MIVVHENPDDERITVTRAISSHWANNQQIAGVDILTILHPIHDYDHCNDSDSSWENMDEDEVVWELESRNNFSFGWSCQC